ncbi:DUF4230 domain-containing protein [Aquimarina brevivitae]|uniref:Uncharacterized protein DUF4230 n=1 Tax=Aquimarina brevivitae TaxID=323412 RepID=A0A4Q7NXQ3_9FLAO|nr:DUF4230 domain-containing protein [Aquimarina brevivitae]RZS92176.1 uncharacterized protein DUF4230 [Aquimarina brevivitae]
MRNFLFGALVAVSLLLVFYFVSNRIHTTKSEIASSDLILKELKNVGKLIVTEGHFSEVITYKNAKKYYLDIFTAKKKALVVVNARVTIAYDLSKLEHRIDTKNKKIILTNIPEPEIDINPDIRYHDLEQDYLNQFTPEDHNEIKKMVLEQLSKKVDKSTLKTNAENRLLSELQKIYILTNSLGWTLEYKKYEVLNQDALQGILQNTFSPSK